MIYSPNDPLNSSGRGRERSESRSPERFNSASLRSRGRETVRAGPGPVVRTQSAASLRSSVQRQQDRSSSLAPPAQQRPSSGLTSSSESLYRSPSYRLLGGKLMDTMLTSRDSSWRDDGAGSGGPGTRYRIYSGLIYANIYLQSTQHHISESHT